MFAIIEFTCTKEVEVVPQIWITEDGNSWWPNLRSTQRIRKLVKEGSPHVEGIFTKYPIRVLKYYGDYIHLR